MHLKRALRRIPKLPEEIADIYRRNIGGYGIVFGILGVAPAIAVALFAREQRILWLLSLAIFLAFILLPIPIALLRLMFAKDQAPAPPDQVREFYAISYALSSDADHKELVRFARAEFNETFPDGVDLGAVRNNCAIGLRLTDSAQKNIGFLDFYHFTKAALTLWRNGHLDETKMTLDDFAPIAPDTASPELELAIGALYIDTASPLADHHLAHALIEAAQDYINHEFSKFRSVILYATIFSQPGRRWAQKLGFILDIPGGKRGPQGRGHDVYVLKFTPVARPPREWFVTYGSHCEYRLRLRI